MGPVGILLYQAHLADHSGVCHIDSLLHRYVFKMDELEGVGGCWRVLEGVGTIGAFA